MKRPLAVHVLYQHGPERRPFGCSYVRLLLPLGHETNQNTLRLSVAPDYVRADVLIVERTWRPGITLGEAEALIDRARRDQCRLIYTLDDNLLDLEELGGLWDRRVATMTERAVIRLLAREAHGVIVSTDTLRTRLAQLNPTVVTVPNAVDERLFALEDARRLAPRDGRTVIGFMGTPTHDGDLMLVAQPLRDVLRRHSGTVQLQIVGGIGDPATLQVFAGLPVIPITPQDAEYPEFVRWMISHLRWNVAIAPLEDTPFNRHKSDIKFLDYSALGIPGLYSNVGPYSQTVHHLETGFLTPNSSETWAENLDRLLADEALCHHLALNARTYVRTHRTLQQCARQWLEAILNILGETEVTGPVQISENASHAPV